MEAYEAGHEHPYGVLPMGNMYFASQSEIMTRYFGLGPHLSALKDETLAEVLSFLNGAELMAVVKVSRTLYCHAHSSDLWRDVTLREFEGRGIKYRNSWKDAYVHTRAHHTRSTARISEHKPIPMAGVFSSYLYRSWSCHTCDLATACPGFYDPSSVPVRQAEDLTVEQFIEQYEIPNKPVVIRGAMCMHAQASHQQSTKSHCPALTRWTNDYLAAQCGPTNRLRATSAAAALPAHFTAVEYFAYAAQAQEEAPLYLFERNFAHLAPGLLRDYEVAAYFRGSSSAHSPNSHELPSKLSNEPTKSVEESGHLNAGRVSLDRAKLSDPGLIYETDLFRLLGEAARPDYRWLVAGPARSGSLFHIDPNQTNAWNLCLRGRKKWIFYPPHVNPPGVESSADLADVVVPISTGEWLLTFWQYHLEARQDPNPLRRPLEVILNPGEVIFVPHGYWHMVVNLDETVALTHNYVSTSNLADCLRFLRDKPEQISGLRDTGGEGIGPGDLYSTFVEKLHRVLPAAEVQRYMQASLQPSGRELSVADKARLVRERAAKAHKRKRDGDPPTCASQGEGHEITAVPMKAGRQSVDVTPFGAVEPECAVEKSAFSFGFVL